MMAHKLIDVLTTRPSPRFLVVEGANKASFVEKLRRAEKFDFGELHLELLPDKDGEPELRHQVPRLTKEEDEWIRNGLLPMPAPICWYEWGLMGHKSGLLVEPGFVVRRADYDWEQGTGLFDDAVIYEGTDGTLCMTGPKRLVEISQNYHTNKTMGYSGNWDLARYFTLMINSRSTTRRKVPGKAPGLPAEREGKREPRYSHTVVCLVPKEHLVYDQASGQTRCSPRIHWRRSHLRTLASGKRIVIPRFLVGRAELGAVSHEYRVPPEGELT